jgi:hypothetical protein
MNESRTDRNRRDGQNRRNEERGKLDEEFASTSNDDRARADEMPAKAPLPQGGKGTPSQAEGDEAGDE